MQQALFVWIQDGHCSLFELIIANIGDGHFEWNDSLHSHQRPRNSQGKSFTLLILAHKKYWVKMNIVNTNWLHAHAIHDPCNRLFFYSKTYQGNKNNN